MLYYVVSRLWILAPASFLWLAGCEAPGPAGSTGLMDTRRLSERWRIGRTEEAGPELFGDITALLVDGLGRLHVVDGLSREVRVFDGDGAFLRTYGRPGAGPGELSAPVGIASEPGGTVWILDVANNRYSLYDTAGAHLADLPRPASGYSVPWLGGFDPEGRLLDATFRSTARGNELILVRSDIMRDPEGVASGIVPVDTFALPLPPADRFLVYEIDSSGRRRGVSVSIPFTSGLRRELTPRGSVWEADTKRYRLVEFVPGGDTVRRVEKQYSSVPVTRVELDSALAELGARTSPDLDYDLERIPREWPALESFFGDAAGRLWVRPIERPPVPGFDLFEFEGGRRWRVESAVRIESTPRPEARGDTLWGVSRDELGVLSVSKSVLDPVQAASD